MKQFLDNMWGGGVKATNISGSLIFLARAPTAVSPRQFELAVQHTITVFIKHIPLALRTMIRNFYDGTIWLQQNGRCAKSVLAFSVKNTLYKDEPPREYAGFLCEVRHSSTEMDERDRVMHVSMRCYLKVRMNLRSEFHLKAVINPYAFRFHIVTAYGGSSGSAGKLLAYEIWKRAVVYALDDQIRITLPNRCWGIDVETANHYTVELQFENQLRENGGLGPCLPVDMQVTIEDWYGIGAPRSFLYNRGDFLNKYDASEDGLRLPHHHMPSRELYKARTPEHPERRDYADIPTDSTAEGSDESAPDEPVDHD